MTLFLMLLMAADIPLIALPVPGNTGQRPWTAVPLPTDS
jgi:hypothetical protein